MRQKYEMIIGLEVHVELKTRSKIFCGCSTAFGAKPNTHCCPVCMGLPGALPVLNEKVVEYAVKAGIALDCVIAGASRQDRKNYFYPDLPKAYQISQYDRPLCEHGHLSITVQGHEKAIGITRIHIEEDAGKLVHQPGAGTLLDFNRCGVPLIEIVSEPDIRSGEEAVQYLKKLRQVLLYTGVSDCRMNEGSMRCDVNLSVRRKGQKEFGIRTEMKNLNSFQSVQRAIAYEYDRQVDVLESGGDVIQETRRFDQQTGHTDAMRDKENADDYRYFPDPDLLPIQITEEYVEQIRRLIPELPDARQRRWIEQYGLREQEAQRLLVFPGIAACFDQAATHSEHPKTLASIMASDLLPLIGDEKEESPIAPEHLAELAALAEQGIVNHAGVRRVLQEMFVQDAPPGELIRRLELLQISDRKVLEPLAKEILMENAQSVQDYRSGKTAALQSLIGKMMQKTHGKCNPILTKNLFLDLLSR